MLKSLWTTGDILPTNLVGILEQQNVDEIDDDELNLSDNTGWDRDNYDKEIDCDIDSDEANVFQENRNSVYDFVP